MNSTDELGTYSSLLTITNNYPTLTNKDSSLLNSSFSLYLNQSSTNDTNNLSKGDDIILKKKMSDNLGVFNKDLDIDYQDVMDYQSDNSEFTDNRDAHNVNTLQLSDMKYIKSTTTTPSPGKEGHFEYVIKTNCKDGYLSQHFSNDIGNEIRLTTKETLNNEISNTKDLQKSVQSKNHLQSNEIPDANPEPFSVKLSVDRNSYQDKTAINKDAVDTKEPFEHPVAMALTGRRPLAYSPVDYGNLDVVMSNYMYYRENLVSYKPCMFDIFFRF